MRAVRHSALRKHRLIKKTTPMHLSGCVFRRTSSRNRRDSIRKITSILVECRLLALIMPLQQIKAIVGCTNRPVSTE